MTVSIVPSTGTFTAWYALVAPDRIAPARISPSTASCSPSTRAIPRTIVLRMTPEFPFASIVAARWTSAASSAVVFAVERSSSSTMPCIVSVRFVPVSPSGTG